jgi:hypothetical protein
VFEGPAPVESVHVDPDEILMLDARPANNRRVVSGL